MKKLIYNLYAVLVCLSFIPFSVYAQDPLSIPEYSARVIDETNTLSDSEKKEFTYLLYDLEQEKGSQVALLIVETTKPETIEEYSLRVVEKWKLGRKDIDDGALLIIAKSDRKLRIEIGKGLEGVLPDVLCKRIIREQISPSFKSGNFAEGIRNGLGSITKIIRGEPLPEPKKTSFLKSGDFKGFIFLLPGIFIFIFLYTISSLIASIFLGILAVLIAWSFMSILPAIIVGIAVAIIAYLIIRSISSSYSDGGIYNSGYYGSSSSSSDSSYSSYSSDSSSSYSSDYSSSSDSSSGGGGGDFGGGGSSGDW
jgi:uncharacterized protein